MHKFIITIVLWIIGCGSRDVSMLKGEGQLPLLFGIGGRNSCSPSGNSPRAMSMYPWLEKVAAKQGLDLALACFDAQGIPYFESEGKVEKLSPEEIGNRLLRQSSNLTVVGHSYGGWLALETVLRLEGVARLYTIDPISPFECNFVEPWRWLGCTRAPSHIPYHVISQKTVAWFNFYQTSTPYLHSSEIPQAANIHIKSRGHTEIDESPEVWDAVMGTNYANSGDTKN